MPNYESITFNNIRKDWLYVERGRRKPPFAARRRNLLTVPGYPGGYLQSTDVEPLLIEQPIGFKVKDDEDALKKKDELAEWLLTNEPVELKFDDEPGRIYYAVVLNTIDDFDRMATLRRGTILFLCPDPYAYGPEKEFSFETDYFNIENKGTAEAEPIFELEVKEPITFAMLQNQFDEYNMIGRPANVDEIAQERYTTILRDTMQSTTGWTTGVNVDSNRIVTGEMKSNGEYFYADSFGTGLEGQYHGPALRKSLSETLQDFRAEALVRFSNSIGEVGRLELHLLDVNNNLIGRVGLYDSSPSRSLTRFSARAGDSAQGQQITDTEAEHWQNWTNFFGLIRLERVGTEWQAYATLIDPITWRYHTAHRRGITSNFGNAEIAQVQIHMTTYTASWGTYEPVYMRVEDLWVKRINDVTGVPIIANPGDIITFDHTGNGQIYINGEPYEDTILGADYFTLKKGDNNIVALPDNALGVSGRYRERWW